MASKAQPKIEKDVLQMEWKECRQTVRNIDKILTTLRIYSLAVTAALMGIATNFFVNKRSDAAVIATLATIALVTVEFCLERHYRGFLLVTVNRAVALEHRLKDVYKNLNVDLDKVEKISVDCTETNVMISELIKKKRESYNWFWKEAHRLIYILLLLSNIALLIFFLYSLAVKL